MINDGMKTCNSCEWATPQDFYDRLNNEFHFTLDPCATPQNTKCKKFYTKEQDGLAQDWTGETVFCNPPYGRDIGLWIQKSIDEVRNGARVVLLIHARTDTKWFHELVFPNASVWFVKGRLKFGGSGNSAPFPSMVAVMTKETLETPEHRMVGLI